MQKATDQLVELVRLLQQSNCNLIAFDGYDGAGKSTLATLVGGKLGIAVVHIDAFAASGQGKYVPTVNLQRLRIATESGPCILEGICVLEVLKKLGRNADQLVYVSSPPDAPNLLSNSRSLASEISSYHRAFQPESMADIVYFGHLWEGRVQMDSVRASIDIAYINAKTRIAISLAIGGMLTLLVGLILLFFGVTSSQDKTLMKLPGLELSAGGLGGVIMTTSVVWAFFAYKARPSYSHSTHLAEKYGQNSQLLERVHFESSTQALVARPNSLNGGHAEGDQQARSSALR